MRHVHLSKIQTLSQRWARAKGACIPGRRRLGRLSLWQYFNRTGRMSDMIWIARRLRPADPQLETLQTYLRQLNRLDCWVRGAYRSPLTYRKAIKLVMQAHDVRWPVELL